MPEIVVLIFIGVAEGVVATIIGVLDTTIGVVGVADTTMVVGVWEIVVAIVLGTIMGAVVVSVSGIVTGVVLILVV